MMQFSRLSDARPDISAIGLRFEEQGGSLRVDVAVLTAPVRRVRSGSLSDLPQEPAGTYMIAMPGEAVAEGLRPFGIEPVRLRVVTNQPEAPGPVEIVNQTTSVAVESIEETRTRFELALKNTGSRGVIALAISIGNGGAVATAMAGPLAPMISPGAVYRVIMSRPQAGPLRLTIAAAFDDGSFEGEGTEIVGSAARYSGQRFRSRKMIAGIQSAFDNGREPKDAAALYALAAAVPLETDTGALSDLLARASSLSERDQDRVRARFRQGIESGRKTFLQVLEQSERVTASISKRDWWAHVRDRYLHGSGLRQGRRRPQEPARVPARHAGVRAPLQPR